MDCPGTKQSILPSPLFVPLFLYIYINTYLFPHIVNENKFLGWAYHCISFFEKLFFTHQLLMPEQGSNGIEKVQKNRDREIRKIIAILTNRLASLRHIEKGANHEDVELEDDDGLSIITLAGNNVGSTMRGEIGEKDSTTTIDHPSQDVVMGGEQEALSTYVNSNFQAINNSIMMGGSYTTNHPGVHMDITDFVENKASSSSVPHVAMHDFLLAKKGTKKLFGSSKSDKQADPFD